MSTKIENAKNALRALSPDEVSAILPFFNSMLSMSRRAKSSAVMCVLEPGDKVQLSNIRPQYMNGSVGTVIRLKLSKVVCTFPNTKWEKQVTVPASCLTKIS